MEVIKGVRIALGRDVSVMIHNFKAGFLSHWKRIVPCRLQNSQTNVIYFHGASIIRRKPVCCTRSAMEGREYITSVMQPQETQRKPMKSRLNLQQNQKEKSTAIPGRSFIKESWRRRKVSSLISFSSTWLVLAYVWGSQFKWKTFRSLKTAVVCLTLIL